MGSSPTNSFMAWSRAKSSKNRQGSREQSRQPIRVIDTHDNNQRTFVTPRDMQANPGRYVKQPRAPSTLPPSAPGFPSLGASRDQPRSRSGGGLGKAGGTGPIKHVVDRFKDAQPRRVIDRWKDNLPTILTQRDMQANPGRYAPMPMMPKVAKKKISAFKKGGRVKRTGLALVHKGETVIPARRSGKRSSPAKQRTFTKF